MIVTGRIKARHPQIVIPYSIKSYMEFHKKLYEASLCFTFFFYYFLQNSVGKISRKEIGNAECIATNVKDVLRDVTADGK